MAECGWCKRPLAAGEERRVPPFVFWPAVVAMAFFHGGLWLQKDLARPYCARCRARIVSALVLFVALAAAVIGAGAWLWLRLFGKFSP